MKTFLGSMLSIRIAELEDGVHELELTPSADDLELDRALFRDIRIHAHLDRGRDRVLVVLDARAIAMLVCDRTLVDFEQPVQGTYSVLFAPPPLASRDLDAYEEVRPLLPSDLEIDLTDVTRDTLLLALPQRRVAPGADDVELQTRFGQADDGIDPRWEALRGLQTDD